MNIEQFEKEANAEHAAISRILKEVVNCPGLSWRWETVVNECREINPTLDKHAIKSFLNCVMNGRDGDLAGRIRRFKAAWELAGAHIKHAQRKD